MKHMKKLLALALVVISMMAITVPALAASTEYVNAPQGPGYAVRIRQSASLNSSILISPTHGSALYTTYYNSDWDQVSYVDPTTGIEYNGYMMSTYLVSSIPTNCYWIVRYGTRDHKYTNSYYAGCSELQTDLNEYFSTRGGTNYNWYPLTVDGICGNNSVAAIRQFQTNNSLVVDGIAGNRTKEYLYKILD